MDVSLFLLKILPKEPG